MSTPTPSAPSVQILPLPRADQECPPCTCTDDTSSAAPRLEGCEAEAGLELLDRLDEMRSELMCAVDQIRGAGDRRDALDSLHEAAMTIELAGCTLRRMLASLAGIGEARDGRATRTDIARALGPIVDAWSAELLAPAAR